MYTRQEIFDIVYSHFILKRNQPAVSWIGACKYITKDDPPRRCAIGIFLPRETAHNWEYERCVGSLELLDQRKESDTDLILADLYEAGLDPHSISFLGEVQSCHDRSYRDPKDNGRCETINQRLESMKVRLERLSRKHNLTIPNEPVPFEVPA